MEKFNEVNPFDYAEKLKQDFYNNPELWYKVIIPKEKAEELKTKSNGDYSLFWHVHCSQCFSTIDRNTGICYLSEDKTTWLCQHCYEEIKGI